MRAYMSLSQSSPGKMPSLETLLLALHDLTLLLALHDFNELLDPMRSPPGFVHYSELISP